MTAGFGTNPIAAPGSGTSTLTLTVASTTTTGTYPITVTGTSAEHYADDHGNSDGDRPGRVLTSPSAPRPPRLACRRGSSGTSTITSTVTGGFDSAIALSASGLPSGVTASFSPTSITGTGKSTLKFTVSRTASTGTHTITITGTGGGKTHTTSVSLSVRGGF